MPTVRPLSMPHAKELADGTVTVEQLMNDNSPEAIAIAEEYLKKMKPNIAGWEADFGKEMMTKGKAWLNFTWSGDAVWAMDEAEAVGVELDYEVPREGAISGTTAGRSLNMPAM